MTPDTSAVDTFTRAYITCALWSSMDDGDPLDSWATVDDIHVDTLAEMREECAAFWELHAVVLSRDPGRAGHDFWLTRNHHGAGFWDGAWGEHGDALTKAAHVWGSVDLYVGDDGRIHAG